MTKFFLALFSFVVFSGEVFDTKKPFHLDFVQKRYIKNVDMEVTSKGSVFVKPGKSLLWEQKGPFRQSFLLENGKFYKMEGREKIAVENFAMNSITSVFLGVLEEDITSLKEKFDIEKKEDTLSLSPKNLEMKKYILKIEIKRKKKVESFYLKEVSGNYLKIKFTSKKE